MNKNDLRYLKTEKIIRAAFLELINERGFENVTISAVCQRAMISRNAFYTHYQSLYSLLDRIYKNLDSVFKNRLSTSNNTEENTKRYISVIDKNRDVISTLLKCPTLKFNDMLFDYVIRRPLSATFADFDSFSENIDIKLNTSYMIDAMISFTKCWLDNYDKISKEEVCLELTLLCEKPVELFFQKCYEKSGK